MSYALAIFYAVCRIFAASQWLTVLMYISLASSLFGAAISFSMEWFGIFVVMVVCHVIVFFLTLGVRIAEQSDKRQ